MATDEEILIVLNSLAEVQACQNCGTRVRFGDRDCSHCGADLEDEQRAWAERLVDRLRGNGAQG
jgi:DNA-directed RNA polymerase subunit RPC12/RpoP